MRPLWLGLCLVPLLAACGSDASDAAASPEDAAERTVKALSEGRFDALEGMLLTAEDLRWLVDVMRGGDSKGAKKFMARLEEVGFDAMLEEARTLIRTSFDSLRKEGADEKVKWADVRFDRLHKLQQNTVEGIEMAKCYIRLHLGDKPGEIRMKTMLRTPRGWVLLGGFKS